MNRPITPKQPWNLGGFVVPVVRSTIPLRVDRVASRPDAVENQPLPLGSRVAGFHPGSLVGCLPVVKS